MFAIRRTDRVMGRIRFLTLSIITMKGIRGPGVPEGTICANMWAVLLIQPKIMNAPHKGKAKARVRAMCLGEVKIYGNSPIKLFIRINKNMEIRRIVTPLVEGVPIRALNSACNLFFKIIMVLLFFGGTNQNRGVRRNNTINELNQLKEIEKIADGSNLEKRLVIIFKLVLRE